MIAMIGNHLLVKANWSDHVQKNSNPLAPKPDVSYFQMKRDDELGLCGNDPSTQIRINKVSEIDPIDQILLPSTIHNHFLNSYFTQ